MEVKMSKYKNKDGIELNYTSNDIQSKLTKEVISCFPGLSKIFDLRFKFTDCKVE